MLEHSGVAPLLHMPVGDILAGKGISIPHPPPMPPLPQLPSLPPLDLTALFKPLTDLLAGFGSGNMANAPFDPTQLFSGLQQAFESVIGLGNQAMSAVAPFWAGAGGASAMVKGTEANANNATTATQSGDISRIVATATATVGKGVALLEGVIANFATSLGAIIPFITTPPGIAAAMASASAHLTTGLGIVAQTRAELTAHTANMTVAGAPVAITAAPQVMSAVPGMASSAVQAVASPIQSLVGGGAGGGLAGGRGFASRVEPFRGGQNADLAAKTSGASAGGGGGGGAIPGVAGLGGASAGASAPTSPFSAKPSDAPMSGRTTAAAQASEEVVGRATTASTVSPGGMPMGAAGAAGATASNSSHSSDRDTSVDARHADDVVGEVPTASPSVLGGVEPSVAESVWDSPDEIES
ncbi:hypothetical protein ASG12_06075 [Williamsia sp. Leaf354]|uniref:hypothetical protein n=1 Tax=Williamsia sp. Leaf354 TaxID=1736349 RepID=UPI000715385A|nr:hypothetical protein [Williamsia sp. Leaf354]KQS00463.1 hypothetical protein ASG12_06075 [Williamsia sp. Leaf354]